MNHRNDPCHCGSGRKYKHCCYRKDTTPVKPEPRKLTPEEMERVARGMEAIRAWRA